MGTLPQNTASNTTSRIPMLKTNYNITIFKPRTRARTVSPLPTTNTNWVFQHDQNSKSCRHDLQTLEPSKQLSLVNSQSQITQRLLISNLQRTCVSLFSKRTPSHSQSATTYLLTVGNRLESQVPKGTLRRQLYTYINITPI